MPVRYRRYTQLPVLIHLLAKSELTLLGPAAWDDRNDSYYIEQYRQKRHLASVLAMCFTREPETYHHWRVFAPGAAGVRVSLDAMRLQPALDAVDGLRLEPVRYVKLKDMVGRQFSVDELPFVKRYPYRAERETRLIWESETEGVSSLALPFDLDAITEITLSPWLHPSLEPELRRMLKSIPGCAKLRVARSTLIGNDQWMGRAGVAI